MALGYKHLKKNQSAKLSLIDRAPISNHSRIPSITRHFIKRKGIPVFLRLSVLKIDLFRKIKSKKKTNPPAKGIKPPQH